MRKPKSGRADAPDEDNARIYREELGRRLGAFDVVAFAIFYAGHGPSNYEVFQRELAPLANARASKVPTPEQTRAAPMSWFGFLFGAEEAAGWKTTRARK